MFPRILKAKPLLFILSILITDLAVAQSSPQLSANEQQVLDDGKIETSSYVVGGLVGTLVIPFGVGQAIQGRYDEKGWIFTVSETASLAAMIGGLASRPMGDTSFPGLALAGAIAFTGFRIWEVVDLWVGPPSHNRRYDRIKTKLSRRNSKKLEHYSMSIYPVQTHTEMAMGTGFSFHF